MVTTPQELPPYVKYIFIYAVGYLFIVFGSFFSIYKAYSQADKFDNKKPLTVAAISIITGFIILNIDRLTQIEIFGIKVQAQEYLDDIKKAKDEVDEQRNDIILIKKSLEESKSEFNKSYNELSNELRKEIYNAQLQSKINEKKYKLSEIENLIDVAINFEDPNLERKRRDAKDKILREIQEIRSEFKK